MGRILWQAALALWVISATAAHAAPSEVRGWTYLSYTLVSPAGWGLTVMPGLRYELFDSEGEAGGLVMSELFAGPFYHHRWGALKLTLPLWYYRMDFPVGEDHYRSHNIELMPIFAWSAGDALTLQARTIFHSKVHASNPVFTEPSQRSGYSLLLREMFTVDFAPPALGGWTLTASEEVFVGLVEDGETRDLVKGEPFFEKRGLSMNRVYLGVKKRIALGDAPLSLVLVPQYVLETHHDPAQGASLTRVRHYASLQVKLVQVLSSAD